MRTVECRTTYQSIRDELPRQRLQCACEALACIQGVGDKRRTLITNGPPYAVKDLGVRMADCSTRLRKHALERALDVMDIALVVVRRPHEELATGKLHDAIKVPHCAPILANPFHADVAVALGD